MLTSLRGLANCGLLSEWRQTVCNFLTTQSDEFLALYARVVSPIPTWRRIVYDVNSDFNSFDLVSMLVSVPPSSSREDYRTVAICGWTIANQENELNPSWCRTAVFNSADNNVQRIAINERNLAFVKVFGSTGIQQPYFGGAGSDAKGAEAIEYFLDDVEVCVPV